MAANGGGELIVRQGVRGMWVVVAVAGLVGGAAAVTHHRLSTPGARVLVAAKASPEPVWSTRVHFDFSQGLGAIVAESYKHEQLSLVESAEAGGSLIQMPRGEGWAIHFPGRCHLDPKECPRAILESGPAGILNPGTRTVRWGASVQMMVNETSDGGNIVQKGMADSGTQFKLQVDGFEGRPSCAVAGPEGKFLALSSIGIADGKWHELACERNKSQLTLYVDGQRMAEQTVPAGLSIVNNAPLRLGGKGHGAYNDQFHGTIDDVFVEIA
jgi:hypothetical protein